MWVGAEGGLCMLAPFPSLSSSNRARASSRSLGGTTVPCISGSVRYERLNIVCEQESVMRISFRPSVGSTSKVKTNEEFRNENAL